MLIQIDQRARREAEESDDWKDVIVKMCQSRMAEQDVKYMAKRRHEIGKANMHAAGFIEGLGQHVADYDADMWFRAMHHGDRYMWADESSIKKYKEDNPEVVIRS